MHLLRPCTSSLPKDRNRCLRLISMLQRWTILRSIFPWNRTQLIQISSNKCLTTIGTKSRTKSKALSCRFKPRRTCSRISTHLCKERDTTFMVSASTMELQRVVTTTATSRTTDRECGASTMTTESTSLRRSKSSKTPTAVAWPNPPTMWSTSVKKSSKIPSLSSKASTSHRWPTLRICTHTARSPVLISWKKSRRTTGNWWTKLMSTKARRQQRE